MIKLRIWIFLFCLLPVSMSVSYAQSSGSQLVGADNQFWTLPATECDGDNFCEVRISPSGTISGWDKVNFRLYISRLNSQTYEVYDLSRYSQYLVFVIDFIVFEELGYAIMYSPVGASRTLTRFNLSTQSLENVGFPSNYRLVGCNRYTAVTQRRLRFIYQLGLEGRLIACTDSPHGNPIIHVIDINTLIIEQSLDIEARFYDVIQPNWIIAGGLNNKIYALVRNPEATMPNLPQIDDATEEIILIYNVDTETWSSQIKSQENTYEILAALPSTGGVFFQNYLSEGKEILQFDSNFQILRRFGLNLGVFQGMTADGYIFFSTGDDYSDIRIINVEGMPEIVRDD